MKTVWSLSKASVHLARPSLLRQGSFGCRTYTFTKRLRQDDHDYEDFYKYTSGRWLWDEESNRRDMYKKFNVPALKNVAARAVGAQSCLSMSKLTEYGSGKVFKLEMDNGATAMAKIPTPWSGPAFRTTASEVATTDFASRVLEIPTPKVLAWSATGENEVEAEYIISEQARGTSWCDLCVGMELEERLKMVQEIIAIEKKMLSVSLNRYGSIYFVEDAFDGCETAQVEGNVSGAKQAEVKERFVVGPTTERSFYNGERASMSIDRGPWSTPTDYLKSTAYREIAWIKQYAQPKERLSFSVARAEVQNSQQAHIDLYEKYLAVADRLIPEDEAMRRPVLWNCNMLAPLIFVEDGKITALTDWWQCHSAPLFEQARVPGIFNRVTKEMSELPDNYDDMEDEDHKRWARGKVANSMRQWSYEHARENMNPELQRVYTYPHGDLLRSTIGFADNTWDGGNQIFRDRLMQIVDYWEEIGDGKPCPISFSGDEVAAHVEEGEEFNVAAEMWDQLAGVVERCGWVENDDYDHILETMAEFREQGLQELEGEALEFWERITRWAARGKDRA